MIAVAVSVLFALYVVGPDAFSRFVIGLTVPRRAVVLTRSEEISRALVWAAGSFFLAYVWCRVEGTWGTVWQPASFRTCFAGLYSEKIFEANQGLWSRVCTMCCGPIFGCFGACTSACCC